MKTYEVYKNIRKSAVIMGLPIAMFALMMTLVIVSLLVIIFSFSFFIVVGAIVLNITVYISLIQLVKNPALLHFKKVFPRTISNKKVTGLNYENDCVIEILSK
ncbi:hypothetical protein C1A40_12760 [Tamlana carrageenivorans]|uniref:DUF4133 domain-containing protein n=1 Tax=Pseudotamlana carrageenivorans TaxID=2069432 RepID=A0A2I7SN50_9FLAO|nr:hypothetical protein [Tamlana carrageenivorans]AUS07339.1 hypothetical protein C1A40_12760 [Tamlana carrageenivorans]